MISEIYTGLDFPEEACRELQAVYEKLIADPAAAALLAEAERRLFAKQELHFLEPLQQIAEKTGLNRYSVDMVFLLMAAVKLRRDYQTMELPDALFWETMMDLRYKLIECRDVYGVWGTFVTGWFRGFYTCERFKLGRLEYEIVPLEKEEYRGIAKKGDAVINCHIPSCGPLTPESVVDSLKQAYRFYVAQQHDGILVVVCHSWLLYKPHYDVFVEGGNVRKFADLFDVTESQSHAENGDFWRVFNLEYSEEALAKAPADTALRRNFLQFLRAGNPMGDGFGLLCFDGEKFV